MLVIAPSTLHMIVWAVDMCTLRVGVTVTKCNIYIFHV